MNTANVSLKSAKIITRARENKRDTSAGFCRIKSDSTDGLWQDEGLKPPTVRGRFFRSRRKTLTPDA
jgi:hypothetical protein